jgi:hypothetical protein
MHPRFLTTIFVSSLSLLGLVHCGDDDGNESKPGGPGSVCDPIAPNCAELLVCAELASGAHQCHPQIVLHGEVRDSASGQAIEGAQVIAIDEEGTAITDVARTDAQGHYELSVPVIRNDDGSPADASITLRVAAQSYLPFPSGARVALPIELDSADAEEHGYSIRNPLTRVDLIPFESGERSQISGSIVTLDGALPNDGAGVLVVATGADGAVSGVSDRLGGFSIFNLPAGDYELKAYGAGVQIESKSVSVPADPLTGVELRQLDQPTTTVSGSVQIVNAKGGSATSVVLVVEDTFDPNIARGEVPRGLRAPKAGDPSVSGSFSISGVPQGNYVVLAAFENDSLVRDPDTNIGGTDYVRLEVAGQPTLNIAESFKVTEALSTMTPGADGPEPVAAKPVLTWADDSSEDWYDLRVFDAFGDEVWTSLKIPGVSGSGTASTAYEGPLEPGMYYQFRVSSWRQPGNGQAAPISATEDLRGVFFLPRD